MAVTDAEMRTAIRATELQAGGAHPQVADLEVTPGMTFGTMHKHIADAVAYQLPSSGPQEWRNAQPADLAERIAVFAVAAISPVIAGDVRASAVRIMRDMIADDAWLARNGLQRIA